MLDLCSSLIDAMLAARPIVASRAGGIPDLIQTKQAESAVGWLVPPEAPEMLAVTINEVLGNAHRAKKYGSNARTRALQHFTADHMVESTIRVYAELARMKYGNQAARRFPELLSGDAFAA